MSPLAPTRAAGKRRYSLAIRLRILRLLFAQGRKSSLSRRVRLWAYRLGMKHDRTIYRWLRRYRDGGANELRDKLRSDTLTRRAPSNVLSITPDSPVRLPLDEKGKKS